MYFCKLVRSTLIYRKLQNGKFHPSRKSFEEFYPHKIAVWNSEMLHLPLSSSTYVKPSQLILSDNHRVFHFDFLTKFQKYKSSREMEALKMSDYRPTQIQGSSSSNKVFTAMFSIKKKKEHGHSAKLFQ